MTNHRNTIREYWHYRHDPWRRRWIRNAIDAIHQEAVMDGLVRHGPVKVVEADRYEIVLQDLENGGKIVIRPESDQYGSTWLVLDRYYA